jgi:hypothetical protein
MAERNRPRGCHDDEILCGAVGASVWSQAAYLPPELPLPAGAGFIRRCRFQEEVSLLPYKAAIAYPNPAKGATMLGVGKADLFR